MSWGHLSWGSIILGGNRWELYGGQLSRAELSGGQLSYVGIARGAIVLGGKRPGAIVQEGIVLFSSKRSEQVCPKAPFSILYFSTFSSTTSFFLLKLLHYATMQVTILCILRTKTLIL